MNLNIESTADGSVTLYRPDIDEHYHSVKGALAESRHIFLNLGWSHLADLRLHPNKNELRVFEVGFGTGLNAAITAQTAQTAEVFTEYFSVELYPVSADITHALLPLQNDDYIREFIAVNDADWNNPVMINPFFCLNKIEDNLLTMKLPQNLDVVYFDAFAPDKQPEMWTEEVFRKIYEALNPGGVLTTYCAKGNIRRLLQSLGFVVERLPGPPGGKREVIRASKTPQFRLHSPKYV